MASEKVQVITTTSSDINKDGFEIEDPGNLSPLVVAPARFTLEVRLLTLDENVD